MNDTVRDVSDTVHGKLDLPDCTRLNQALPTTKRRMTTRNKSYNMNDAWVRALPSDVDEIEGFERHEDWIDGFGVYARLRDISEFTGGKEVRRSDGVRSEEEAKDPSTSYKSTLLVSPSYGRSQTSATPSDDPALSLASDVPSLWVSLDTEFTGGEGVDEEWDGQRSVVSWQFCFARGGDIVELMVVPRTERPLCLSHALNLVCELAGCEKRYYRTEADRGRSKGERPVSITLISHAGIVDLSTFIGSKHLMQRMVDNGGAMFNAMDYVLRIVRDRDRNTYREVSLKVRDTMSFTAKGTSLGMMGDGLADDGSFRKLDMSEEDYQDMGGVLREEPERFAEYAIRDVEICWAYMARFLGTHDREFASTIPALSARYLKDYLMEREYGDEAQYERHFRGLEKVRDGLVRDERSSEFRVAEHKQGINIWSDDITTYCRNAYKGGMNACTIPGYFDCETYDYDLTSAYPLSLGSLRDPDFESPFEKTYDDVDLDPKDPYLQDAFRPGAGQVTFEFPEGCYQPCIAMHADGNLVFPRTSDGTSGVYVTMPEVVCALKLGARVHALRFIVAKAADDVTVLRGAFKSLIDARSAAADEHGKKSVQALSMKLVANTLYGKMAQALSIRRYRDLYDLMMKDLKTSPVTSAYHAATGTAVTRCVMAVAANQLHGKGYRVFSTTTDGFISDAPKDVLDGLDLLGLRARLAETRRFYTDGATDDIFEVKHVNEALMNLTTRCNVAPNVEGVFARLSAKGYPEFEPGTDGSLVRTSRHRARFMTDALNRKAHRKGTISYENNHWVSAYHMLKNDEDFHTYRETRFTNPNFDLKRKPAAGTLRDVLVDVPGCADGAEMPLATFDTLPYDNLDEFRVWRSWRDRVLVNKADFEQLAADAATGMRESRKYSRRDKIRLAFTAHRAGLAEIPRLEELRGAERLAWINTFLDGGDAPFKPDDWKNAHRQERMDGLPDPDEYEDVVEEMGGRLKPDREADKGARPRTE